MTDEGTRRLARKVLSDPSLFPPEFKSWIPKHVEAAATIKFASYQVPTAFRLSGSKVFDWGSIAAGAQATTTVTVIGAVVGDFVVVAQDVDLQGMQMTAHVSAVDIVSVVLRNGTAGAIDLASSTLRVAIFRR